MTRASFNRKRKHLKVKSTERANGLNLNILGFVQCNVYYRNTTIKQNFHVIKNLTNEIIIDRDSKRLQNMKIDFERNLIWINGISIRMSRSQDEVAIQTAV
eukprot:NODE_228_length_12276_cov_0.305337.p7 type:complete len:101 gc:universal NODE_228_length_12276_cov_0.305337:10690-10992(+)